MAPRQLRSARREDLPQLVELWELAFGDEPGFVEGFFAAHCPLDQVLVAAEGGSIRAMLSLLPLQWRQGGEERALAYVYALATHPADRGKGHAHALLAYADQRAAEAGFDGICTVPARGELHPFFASAGYREGLGTRRRVYARQGLEETMGGELPRLRPCSPADYGLLREERLGDIPHAAYPVGLLTFQAEQGELYAIDLPGGRGCMAVEEQGDALICKELLAPAGEEELALAALARLRSGQHYELRSPGEGWQFGMGKWFRQADAPAGYLGLAFD